MYIESNPMCCAFDTIYFNDEEDSVKFPTIGSAEETFLELREMLSSGEEDYLGNGKWGIRPVKKILISLCANQMGLYRKMKREWGNKVSILTSVPGSHGNYKVYLILVDHPYKDVK